MATDRNGNPEEPEFKTTRFIERKGLKKLADAVEEFKLEGMNAPGALVTGAPLSIAASMSDIQDMGPGKFGVLVSLSVAK